jgi:hypothetical protein
LDLLGLDNGLLLGLGQVLKLVLQRRCHLSHLLLSCALPLGFFFVLVCRLLQSWCLAPTPQLILFVAFLFFIFYFLFYFKFTKANAEVWGCDASGCGGGAASWGAGSHRRG